MLTLENYLTQIPPATSFGAGLQRLCDCSLFAKRLLTKDATLLEDLLENHAKAYTLSDMQTFLDTFNLTVDVDDSVCQKALRKLRQRVMLRVIYRDLNGLADLPEVVMTVSNLAEFAVNKAISFHQTKLIAQYGAPCNVAGKSQSLIVIGMGKLGGMELNVSSDIDLIFSYEEDGETNIDGPQKRISNQDFFIKLGKN